MSAIVAILGDPVAHSRSPAMHNAAFRALDLPWQYVAHRVASRDLKAAVEAIRALGYRGANVTVPHKERIIRWLDELRPAAARIGAVNTIIRRGERLIGENTDAEGFRRAISELGFRARGKSVLVVGAGGSARAVIYALSRSGIGEIRVANRTRSRALALRKLLSDRPRIAFEAGALERASDPAWLSGADLIVQTTSIGLDGKSLPPVDLRRTRDDCVVYDLVYGPRETPFVRAARRLGRTAADGRRMLLHQAALAFLLWTRRRPPLEAMATAL